MGKRLHVIVWIVVITTLTSCSYARLGKPVSVPQGQPSVRNHPPNPVASIKVRRASWSWALSCSQVTPRTSFQGRAKHNANISNFIVRVFMITMATSKCLKKGLSNGTFFGILMGQNPTMIPTSIRGILLSTPRGSKVQSKENYDDDSIAGWFI